MSDANDTIPDDLDARDLRLVLQFERKLTKHRELMREEIAGALRDSMAPLVHRLDASALETATFRDHLSKDMSDLHRDLALQAQTSMSLKERVSELEDGKKQTRLALIGAVLGLVSSLVMWAISLFKG